MKSTSKPPAEAKVAALAQRCGCDEYVARAALSQIKRDALGNGTEAAARLLCEGAEEMKRVYAREMAELGDTHGDAVFQHPYVQCLLEAARNRVHQTLAKQSGPEADRWLICVRTYGRARSEAKPELDDWLSTVGVKKDKVAHLGDALRSIGIDDSDKCKVALRAPKKVVKQIADAGLKLGFHAEGFIKKAKAWREKAEINAKKMSTKLGKSVARNPGIRDLTLNTLKRCLGPDCHRRCLIFVSHEDADFVSGRYARALKGSPWENRVIMGVKGAHLQVRFIEEAAPIGTHVIVADDNIDAVMVEVAEESQKLKGEKGGEYWHRALDCRTLQGPLDGTGLRSIGEESELSRFVRACWPKKWDDVKQAPALRDAEQRLKREGIDSPSALVDFTSVQVQLVSKILGVPSTRVQGVAQVGQLLPPRRTLVASARAVPQQRKGLKHNSEKEMPELAALISRAARAMTDYGANVWSVSNTQNHYFLHEFGETMRTTARKTGVLQEITTKLSLIYGAFFGFKALHDRRRYTRFGQVKDDVERTLRYWHCDGKCLRFQRYAVVKRHPPGKFHAKKGGISAATGATGHEQEGHKAVRSIITAFAWRYARLPVPGERCSDVGLVWLPQKLQQKADTPDEEAPPLAPEEGPMPKRPPTCRPTDHCRPAGTVRGISTGLLAARRLSQKRPAAAAPVGEAKRAR